jgi:predicted nucleotidyltransferase
MSYHEEWEKAEAIMQSSKDILATLREQHAILSRRYPIRRMALFGSWARGEARENSDVDVLVDVDPSIGLRFVELGDELERALGRRVDLVSRRAIKPALWERIEPELIDA